MHTYTPYLNEADSYFKTVHKSVTKTHKLGNKVIFSMSTMIIEKYFVALLMAKDIPVSGHSMKTLMELAKQNFDMPEALLGLEELDDKLDLCSFDSVIMHEISDTDIGVIHDKLVALRGFVYSHLEIPECA